MRLPRFKEVGSWNEERREDFRRIKYRNILGHRLMEFLLYQLLNIRQFRIEVNTLGNQEK